MPLSDSIGRYDRSQELYSTAYTPQQLRRQQTERESDTMETPRERHDRLAPQKIGGQDNKLAADRAVVVARAGRFVFLAVAAPPFLAFVTIPKLMLLQVLPMVFQQIAKGFNFAKENLARWGRMIQWQLANFFRQLFDRFRIRTERHESNRSSFRQRLWDGVKRLALRLSNVAIKVGERINESVGEAAKKLKTLADTIKAKTVNAVKQAATPINDYVVQPAYNFLLWYSGRINQTSQTYVLNPLRQLWQGIKGKLNQQYQYAIRALKWINEVSSRVLVRLYHYAKPVLNVFTKPLKRLLDGFKERKNKTKAWLFEKERRFRKNFLARVFSLIDQGEGFYLSLWQKISLFFTNLLIWINRKFPWILKILKGTAAFLLFLEGWIKRLIGLFFKTVSLTITYLGRGVEKTYIQTKKISGIPTVQLGNPIGSLFSLFKKIGQKIMKGLVQASVFINVFFHTWLEQLKELDQRLSSNKR